MRSANISVPVIAENAVNPHHVRFVHKTPISPTELRETRDDATWVATVGFGKRNWARNFYPEAAESALETVGHGT
jgi:phenylpropionate dioxygenase-like ring-hydroxylating dioxygenase large terminal subunit